MDCWDDPGDYPSNAGAGPLPSYTFVAGVDGQIVIDLEEEDGWSAERPVSIEVLQENINLNPGGIDHDVAGLTVKRWRVDSFAGNRVTLSVPDEDEDAWSAENPQNVRRESMKYFNVTFRKHFNAEGEGNDYPTDNLIVLHNVDIEDPLFVEMIPPADGGEWGTETWNFSVEDEHASYFQALLQDCETVTAFDIECGEPGENI